VACFYCLHYPISFIHFILNLTGSQKVKSWFFVPHDFFGESEKCRFRFPYKSMTNFADLCFGPVIELGAPHGAR